MVQHGSRMAPCSADPKRGPTYCPSWLQNVVVVVVVVVFVVVPVVLVALIVVVIVVAVDVVVAVVAFAFVAVVAVVSGLSSGGARSVQYQILSKIGSAILQAHRTAEKLSNHEADQGKPPAISLVFHPEQSRAHAQVA